MDDLIKGEPEIIVNGKPLTQVQAMCVRVAIGSFLIELSDLQYRKTLGEELSAGYEKQLQSVERIMCTPQ